MSLKISSFGSNVPSTLKLNPMTKHVISIGDLVLDVVLPVNLPIRAAQHQTAPFRRVEPGGAASFMIAARHMGLKVSAVGAVGADVFGTQLVDLLRAEGIDTTCIDAVPGSTSTLVIVLIDPESGEHVFVGNYGDGPEMAYPAGLDEQIAGADALFIMGYTLAEKRVLPVALRAIEQAAAVKVPVIVDVGPFLALVPRDQIAWVVERTALLLMTEEEVPLVSDGLSGEAAYQKLLRAGPSALIVKSGPSGCTVISLEEQRHIPGFSAKVVDTVGAGDCFAGAFVAGMLRGLSLIDAARLANAMGAATVARIGAGRNAPTCAEVLDVLKQAGETLEFSC
jgi:sugar/nucleoside kinase (ribokinase family)